LNGPRSFADEVQYVEPGRFGVEGLVSQEGFKVGLTRETDRYEVSLDANGSNTTGGMTMSSFAFQTRVGLRYNLGSYNYLSYGAFFGETITGQNNDISTAGTYRVAPYIGFQRHFSGTNLMLTLFVLPYAYNHAVNGDGKGNAVNSSLYFIAGGFGLAYLF